MMATMKITLILLVTVKTIMIYKTMLLNRNLRREGKLIALKSMQFRERKGYKGRILIVQMANKICALEEQNLI